MRNTIELSGLEFFAYAKNFPLELMLAVTKKILEEDPFCRKQVRTVLQEDDFLMVVVTIKLEVPANLAKIALAELENSPPA